MFFIHFSFLEHFTVSPPCRQRQVHVSETTRLRVAGRPLTQDHTSAEQGARTQTQTQKKVSCTQQSSLQVRSRREGSICSQLMIALCIGQAAAAECPQPHQVAQVTGSLCFCPLLLCLLPASVSACLDTPSCLSSAPSPMLTECRLALACASSLSLPSYLYLLFALHICTSHRTCHELFSLL